MNAVITRRGLFGALGSGVLVSVEAQGAVTRIHVGDSGVVILLTGKVELGQGARTILAQAVAEEMRVPFERVRVVMGDTELVPDDGGTWGSLTAPQTFPVVREAAAAARKAAALTPASEWKVLGTPVVPARAREMVTGALEYSTDVKRPCMLHGKVIRAPYHRATVVSAEGPGLIREGDFMGVVAATPREAGRAAARVKAEWKGEPLALSDQLSALFKKTAGEPNKSQSVRYPAWIERGDFRKGLSAGDHRHEGVYTTAYIAHQALEPRAAVAEWNGGRLTVWCGSQAPFIVRKQLSDAFKLAESEVRVISLDVGGGFGGKQGGEVALEAARLARAAGKPVKLQWSREEEAMWAYARPAALLEVRTATTKAGRFTGWEFRNYNSGAAGLGHPYDIADSLCAFHRTESPIRQGSYRSLAAVANTFAREAHVNELALFHKTDPVEFRLKNIADARLREAIMRAAERFGWGKTKHGAGMCCNLEKDARIALFCEVEKTRVVRITIAFDPGAILNPGILKSQITGGIIQGIGGALFEALRYDRNKILNPRFSAYRVPRFRDAPEIEVLLIDRRDVAPAGAGESPITVVAPAIEAALFSIDGIRRRQLPLLR
jgi:isoquinoline 1-oxidoreductase